MGISIEQLAKNTGKTVEEFKEDIKRLSCLSGYEHYEFVVKPIKGSTDVMVQVMAHSFGTEEA